MLHWKVLKHLTVKRPVEASRMEFFAHAEAFAALVNLEFVSINGASKTSNFLYFKCWDKKIQTPLDSTICATLLVYTSCPRFDIKFHLSFVGAITTIITLLRKPETRCAAVTMLGKTVELCLQQVATTNFDCES